MLNMDDVDVGVKELERSHKLGFSGAMISVYPLAGSSTISPGTNPSGPPLKAWECP